MCECMGALVRLANSKRILNGHVRLLFFRSYCKGYFPEIKMYFGYCHYRG